MQNISFFWSANRRSTLILVLLAIGLLLCLFLALSLGSQSMGLAEVWSAIVSPGQTLNDRIIRDLRLPRALLAMGSGGLLALAGALMQVLLRNPLADPYVLGISGGAATGALLALLLGAGALFLNFSALLGALLASGIVFGLARGMGSWTPTRLLLTGVILAAGWNAIISFVLAIAPDAALRGMIFWIMGDLSYATQPGIGLLVLLAGLILSWPLARQLNILARGDTVAGALGVPVMRLNKQLYLLAAVLTATAVTQAGSIGFVGLVVPHMLRLAGLHDHRVLLPACLLGGATLLLLADTLARTLLAPQQLPVGVITAGIGVPVFLYLLHREARAT